MTPDYFHKVVDCQWGCPAHTDVPEYIRLIAQGRFSDAYMVNRESNLFPGILGRVCDRPCDRPAAAGVSMKKTGGDLPAQARGGGSPRRHYWSATKDSQAEERQESGAGRCRLRVTGGLQ